MRESIKRRKAFVARCKLRRKHPGRYRVVSDYGWGDRSVIAEDLPIEKALQLWAKTARYRIEIFDTSTINLAFDRECTHHIE